MIAILGTNGSFNDRLYLRESHNCYSYLINLKSPEAEQLWIDMEMTFAGEDLAVRTVGGAYGRRDAVLIRFLGKLSLWFESTHGHKFRGGLCLM